MWEASICAHMHAGQGRATLVHVSTLQFAREPCINSPRDFSHMSTTPKTYHFLTETGRKILQAQTTWHFRLVHEKKSKYSLRDPDWDIVHRKTSQLTSRKFFIEDVSPGLLPASSVHDMKYKKPRPFIGAQNHTNVGITPETVTKFFPKSQITFPVPTLNSTGSHSTLGYALPRCPCS